MSFNIPHHFVSHTGQVAAVPIYSLSPFILVLACFAVIFTSSLVVGPQCQCWQRRFPCHQTRISPRDLIVQAKNGTLESKPYARALDNVQYAVNGSSHGGLGEYIRLPQDIR